MNTYPSTNSGQDDKTITASSGTPPGAVVFGFWVYLMSDCVLFATLFATYAVLQDATFGGPTAAELFSLPFVLVETLILLTSSFTVGLAAYLASKAQKSQHSRPLKTPALQTFLALLATLVLGVAFLSMELYEFAHLIAEGHGPAANAFLSSFFTLVGTHGLHVLFGALWMVVVMAHVLTKGLTAASVRKITIFSLFWHFLDVIWIFIFTFVYLFGAIL
jgi:cytochrome o ubiquinol oxidase subunit 3